MSLLKKRVKESIYNLQRVAEIAAEKAHTKSAQSSMMSIWLQDFISAIRILAFVAVSPPS